MVGNVRFAVNSQHAKQVRWAGLSCWLEKTTHGGEPQGAALNHPVLAFCEVTLSTCLVLSSCSKTQAWKPCHVNMFAETGGPDKRNFNVFGRAPLFSWPGF